MNKTIILLAVVAAIGLSACARRVTIDPRLVFQKNSRDWTVKSEPQKTRK